MENSLNEDCFQNDSLTYVDRMNERACSMSNTPHQFFRLIGEVQKSEILRITIVEELVKILKQHCVILNEVRIKNLKQLSGR